MKPSTLARSIAARQRGAKSRGPVAPKGKRRASLLSPSFAGSPPGRASPRKFKKIRPEIHR